MNLKWGEIRILENSQSELGLKYYKKYIAKNLIIYSLLQHGTCFFSNFFHWFLNEVKLHC